VPESYLRLGALDHRHLDARAVDDPGEAGVTLCERRFVGKINLRGEPTRPFRDAVKKALGAAPPTKPNTTAAGRDCAILWLGPNEWLVTTPPGGEVGAQAALREALGQRHAAVTDVSEARAVIALGGPRARDVLAKGCPLDLHPRAFKAGDCAQSTLAKALVILHQTADAPAYDIYVDRSFADYLWRWLEDAAAEYGLAIVRG